MEWLIHIEGKADERILVTFDPLDESISFYGQYKVKFKDYAFTSAESKQWVIFSEDHDAMNIDLNRSMNIYQKYMIKWLNESKFMMISEKSLEYLRQLK